MNRPAHCGTLLEESMTQCAVCRAPLAFVGTESALRAAISDSRDGAVIVLAAGTYTLPAWIKLTKSLELVGSGMEETRIQCGDREAVLYFDAGSNGSLRLSHLTLAHTGFNWANVVSIKSGQVRLEACKLTGGQVFVDSGKEWQGDGLRLAGSARAEVLDCVMTRNRGSGIGLLEHAELSATRTTASWNCYHGIEVQRGACATLTECEGRSNHRYGIYIEAETGGTIRRSTCSGNEFGGIYVGASASPLIEGNRLTGNHGCGIFITGRACPVVKHNTCEQNRYSGMAVDEHASPDLSDNACCENLAHGLSVAGSAEVRAENNKAHRNGYVGIQVSKQATALLYGNVTNDNGRDGICYQDQARGEARGNRATGNRYFEFCLLNGATLVHADNDPQPVDDRGLVSPASMAIASSELNRWLAKFRR